MVVDGTYKGNNLMDNRLSKLILYVSHPYGGNQDNLESASKLVLMLCKNEKIHRDFCIVSPVHNYGFMYNEYTHMDGMQFCLDLLAKSDIMVVFGNYEASKGCTMEIEYCKENNIPYLIIKPINITKYLTGDEIYSMIKDKLACKEDEHDEQ